MRKVLKVLACVVLLGLSGVLLLFAGFEVTSRVARSSLPEVVDADRFVDKIWQTTRVYSADGVLLAEYFRERRTVVPLTDMPEHLFNAVIAAEDKNFRNHSGVDWLAVTRAATVGIFRGRFAQGASTITQQLARNLYLSRERTLWRKMKEALHARKLEVSLDKDGILYQYLNLIYWGHGNYGIEEAVRYYFGKGVGELELAESALLAGIISAPEAFSPVKAPDRARVRMQYVIDEMADAGTLPAGVESVPFPSLYAQRPVASGLSPYGVDAALVELFRIAPKEGFDRAGYRLDTTIDSRLQQAMNDGIAAALPSLGLTLSVRRDEPSPLCDCIGGEITIRPGCPVWAKVLRQTEDGSGYLVSLLGRLGMVPRETLKGLAASGAKIPTLKPGRYVRVMPTVELPLASPWLTEETVTVPVITPQVAAVLLHAPSGEVRALYGGVDHRHHPYNRALSASRQVGSTIKPFVYLAAMELLGWDEDTLLDATPLNLPGAGGRRWKVRDSHAHEDRLTVEEALQWSVNTTAVRAVQQMGLDAFMAQWALWGLPEIHSEDLSVALGSVSLTPLELARAYALFAGAGCVPDATVLTSVSRSGRGALPLPPLLCTGPAPGAGAARIRGFLRSVVDSGTGKKARIEGVDAAGKTGTSPGGRDAWFVGMANEYVLVVWVGSDDYSPVPDNSGPQTAALVWREMAVRMFSADTP